MEPEELVESGLTLNQATVYLELLKRPEQSGGQIAKKTSIDRSFVYGILNSLIDKGLVVYITRGNTRLFSPSNPENLLKEVEEKRTKIEKIVTNLKEVRQEPQSQKSVQIYEGKSGLKAYIRDLITSDFITFGGGGNLGIQAILDTLKYDYPHYLKELNKRGVSGKLITSSTNKKFCEKVFKNSRLKIKTLQRLKSNVSITISKDKLAIYSAEEKPFVIVIEDKKISNMFRDYFDSLWELIK